MKLRLRRTLPLRVILFSSQKRSDGFEPSDRCPPFIRLFTEPCGCAAFVAWEIVLKNIIQKEKVKVKDMFPFHDTHYAKIEIK